MEIIKANNYRKDAVVLPCPFCGEKEEIFLWQYEHHKNEKRWRICCASCMAKIDRGYDQKTGELIYLLNKRK